MKQTPATRHPLAPPAAEIWLILIATLIAVVGFSYGGSVAEVTNTLIPVLLIASQATGIFVLLQQSFDTMWTPVIWQRVALIFYFGIGSLVPGFVNDETRNLIFSFYSFFPEDVAKYNLVNCVFISVSLIVSIFLVRKNAFSTKLEFQKFERSALDARILGIILIVAGMITYYPITFPALLGVEGANTNVLLVQFANGIEIGIFLLTIWSLANRSYFLVLAIAVTIIQAVAGMILLTKYAAILPLIMFGMAFIYHYRKFRYVLIGVIGVYALFGLASDIVSYGRGQAGSNGSGGFGAATVSERISILSTYGGRDASTNESAIQSGWARLSYVNGGTFAINQYDAGIPGDSLEYLPYVWLPRFIYPEKPNLTDKAYAFNVAITGSDTSASTPGIPSEGYWNFGWLGVIMIAAFSGATLMIWSQYIVAVIQSGAWHLFFVVLLGMRTGTRVDGMFVTDIVGPIGYAILGHVVLQFLNRTILRRLAARTTSAAV